MIRAGSGSLAGTDLGGLLLGPQSLYPFGQHCVRVAVPSGDMPTTAFRPSVKVRWSGLRYMYVLWVAATAVWGFLAIITEDTGARWLYGIAAVLSAVSAVGSWWQRRKNGERGSADIDQQNASGR